MPSKDQEAGDIGTFSPQDTLVSLPITGHPRSYSPSIESLPHLENRQQNSVSAVATTTRDVVYQYLEWDSEIPEDDVAALPSSIKRYTDPFAWSKRQKSWTLVLACGSTFLAAFCAGAYTAGLDDMMKEWNVSKLVLLGALSVFTVGFATAPMFLAPLSEVIVTCVIYIIRDEL